MAIVNETDAAKYYNKQPKKRVAAGMLIFNEEGQVLVVKPNYLDRWLYPGGGVDECESPLAAAIRECREEIGVSFDEVWPAYVNYVEPQASGYDDMMQSLFTTHRVGEGFLSALTLQATEIDDAKFVSLASLSDYVGEMRATAVRTYVEHGIGKAALYLENGLLV